MGTTSTFAELINELENANSKEDVIKAFQGNTKAKAINSNIKTIEQCVGVYKDLREKYKSGLNSALKGKLHEITKKFSRYTAWENIKDLYD